MYGAASAARRFVSERAIGVGARTVAEALSARFLPGNFSWRAKGPYGRDSCHMLKGRMRKVTRLGSLLGSAASVGGCRATVFLHCASRAPASQLHRNCIALAL